MVCEYWRPIHDGRNFAFAKLTDSSATLRWRIRTVSKWVGQLDIAAYGWANSLLPVPYQSMLSPTLLCRKISIDQQSDSPQHWIAQADYSSEPLNDNEQDEQDDPTQRPAEVEMESYSVTEVAFKDRNGAALVNSAGDYFDPPIERQLARWRFNIKKNVAALPTWILSYPNKVNSAAFTCLGLTVAPRCGRLGENFRIGSLKKEGDYLYHELQFSIDLNPDTWDVVVLDQGLRVISGTNQIPILDANLDPINSPALLDGSGARLANPSTATAVFRTFQVDGQVDFNALPLT